MPELQSSTGGAASLAAIHCNNQHSGLWSLHWSELDDMTTLSREPAQHISRYFKKFALKLLEPEQKDTWSYSILSRHITSASSVFHPSTLYLKACVPSFASLLLPVFQLSSVRRRLSSRQRRVLEQGWSAIFWWLCVTTNNASTKRKCQHIKSLPCLTLTQWKQSSGYKTVRKPWNKLPKKSFFLHISKSAWQTPSWRCFWELSSTFDL